MTPPVRYNAEQAGDIVGKSKSWMYQKGAAGEIPRSKLGHHVFWTPEQLAQILQGAAQEPKQRKSDNRPAEQRQRSAPPKKQQRRKRAPAPAANAVNIPQADFGVSRLYRTDGAA